MTFTCLIASIFLFLLWSTDVEIYIDTTTYLAPEGNPDVPCPVRLSAPYPEPINVTIELVPLDGGKCAGVHACVHMCMRVCVFRCMHVCASVLACVHACVHVCVRTCVHACLCAWMRA